MAADDALAVGLPETSARREPVAISTRGPRGRRWWRELGWRYVVAVVGILFALMPAVENFANEPSGSVV